MSPAFQNRNLLLAAMACSFAFSGQLIANEFKFFHEDVLGTSLELKVVAPDEETAKQAESIVLQEVDRLSEVFSHYSASSEFRRLCDMPSGSSTTVSSDLMTLLRRCEEWTRISHGAFNPGAELLCRRWQQAASNGVPPSAEELRELAGQVNQAHWNLTVGSNTVTRLSTVPLTLNAIAKGSILDAASLRVFDECMSIEGITVNIGGDIRVAGQASEIIQVADPLNDSIGSPPIQTIVLARGAIATSGISERSHKVGQSRLSHIINPVDGQPCNQIISASVIANDAETADVLATIFTVAPVSASLNLAETIPGVECFLVDVSGSTFCSANWPGSKPDEVNTAKPVNEAKDQKTTEKEVENTPHDFRLEFEINKPSEGGRYRRPYVAVWVEDKDDFPVKTLSLFMMTENPGPRWHRDLRRWYSNDRLRLLADEKELIGTISKPTRNPGTYKVAWDGRDDNGNLLKEGKYTLYIEAAREHGTYQLMKYPFEFGKTDFSDDLKGNVEIKSASISYEFGVKK
jgi:thiamine biosynthesis lipoprotein ApbE